MKQVLISMALVVVMAPPVAAADLAIFDRPSPDDLDYAGFKLNAKSTVTLTSSGFAYRSWGRYLVLTDAWILDAGSRAVVWSMTDARSEWKVRELQTETFAVELPAGTYEVYYSTFPDKYERERRYSMNMGEWFSGKSAHDMLEDLMDDENVDSERALYRRMSLKVVGDGIPISREDISAAHEATREEAVVSAVRLGDHEYVAQGFRLDQPMKLRIYAHGEATEDGDYDYAWIVNTDTRERVWRFTWDDADFAGGAQKNRMMNQTVEAVAGNYVLYATTDGSHSWPRFNSAPPRDPAYWGVLVSAVDPADRKSTRTFDYEEQEWKTTVVDLTPIGEEENRRAGFTLGKKMKLRVYAIGEGREGEMYDYGWIVDARTRQRVWTMRYEETEHAGGGEKNRITDSVVELDKGDYIAWFVSDEGHSYPNWNATPPADRRRYGLTIAATSDGDAKSVKPYRDDPASGGSLVQIIGVGNDAYLNEDFTLDKKVLVHLYAVGEGVDGRMYDFGWIEDTETGRVVWEMTYRKTEHAGGAQKNRMFSDSIELGPGTYRVFFETDDSHAFPRFNAARPIEPEQWGIQISVVKP